MLSQSGWPSCLVALSDITFCVSQVGFIAYGNCAHGLMCMMNITEWRRSRLVPAVWKGMNLFPSSTFPFCIMPCGFESYRWFLCNLIPQPSWGFFQLDSPLSGVVPFALCDHPGMSFEESSLLEESRESGNDRDGPSSGNIVCSAGKAMYLRESVTQREYHRRKWMRC